MSNAFTGVALPPIDIAYDVRYMYKIWNETKKAARDAQSPVFPVMKLSIQAMFSMEFFKEYFSVSTNLQHKINYI